MKFSKLAFLGESLIKVGRVCVYVAVTNLPGIYFTTVGAINRRFETFFDPLEIYISLNSEICI